MLKVNNNNWNLLGSIPKIYEYIATKYTYLLFIYTYEYVYFRIQM